MQTNLPPLEDFKVNLKLKLAALWAALMFCYIYGDYFELYLPNQLQNMVNGKVILDSPLKLLAAAVLMTVPSVMIFLALVLKPQLNRWVNVGLGLFYTLVMVLVLSASLSYWRAFYVFLGLVEIAISLTIAWYAWNWPRKDQQNG